MPHVIFKSTSIKLFLILFTCSGGISATAQNGFTNKTEAKNEYVDSLKQGKWIEYVDALYRPTKKDSWDVSYYRLSIYNAGKEQGMVRYYTTKDTLHEEVPYVNGKREGMAIEYESNGAVRTETPYNNDKVNGLEKMYWKNRKLSMEMPVANDKLNGVFKEYYESGHLQKETPYIFDKLNGHVKEYYETGQLKKETSYIFDKLNGPTKEYSEQGQLISETSYNNDTMTGLRKDYYYHKNGKLWSETSYMNSDWNGVQKIYDEDGKLVSTSNINGYPEQFDWEEADRELIKKIVSINENKSKEVEKLFSASMAFNKDSLGFGWAKSTLSLPGGYTAIKADFYYYNDSIVCYTLTPTLPEDEKLRTKFMQWYYPYFTKLDTIEYTTYRRRIKQTRILVHPFEFNKQGLLRPLKEYSSVQNRIQLSEDMLNYMSPLPIGNEGDYPLYFSIKKGLDKIKDSSLTDDEIIALLYSINPSSRLTAIIYCVKRNNNLINRPEIKSWIDKIYSEVPEMMITNYDYSFPENPREIVRLYTNPNH
jgi:antitoxin component YwqK of YwqJK toxin-antitoxin module